MCVPDTRGQGGVWGCETEQSLTVRRPHGCDTVCLADTLYLTFLTPNWFDHYVYLMWSNSYDLIR